MCQSSLCRKKIFHITDPDLATRTGPSDPDNPENWPKGYRWLLCSIMTINMSADLDTYYPS